MISRAFDLGENTQMNNARIFGEFFRLEMDPQTLLDAGRTLEGYVDEQGIEHIRICRIPDDVESDALWDILCYEEDEAPLELFEFQDDIE